MAKTGLDTIRTNRRIEQLKNNAEQEPEQPKRSYTPILSVAFVLAFVGLITALGIGAPVSADPNINLTWVGTLFASLIEAANTCAAPFQSFMQVWFPVIIELLVYGVIFGVIGVIGYAFRETIVAGVKMIINILK